MSCCSAFTALSGGRYAGGCGACAYSPGAGGIDPGAGATTAALLVGTLLASPLVLIYSGFLLARYALGYHCGVITARLPAWLAIEMRTVAPTAVTTVALVLAYCVAAWALYRLFARAPAHPQSPPGRVKRLLRRTTASPLYRLAWSGIAIGWVLLLVFFVRVKLAPSPPRPDMVLPAASPLRQHVEQLALVHGITSINVRVRRASEYTRQMGARAQSATGLVVFDDTLLDGLDDKEEFAVAAHEVGHLMQRSGIFHLALWVLIVISTIACLAATSLDGGAMSRPPPAILRIPAFVFTLLLAFTLFDVARCARQRPYEVEADRFATRAALRLGHSPESLRSALIKVRDSRRAPEPNRFFALLFREHPSTAERLAEIDKVIAAEGLTY